MVTTVCDLIFLLGIELSKDFFLVVNSVSMAGARSMAASNILLLRKAEDKRQIKALRRAFQVTIVQKSFLKVNKK